MAVVPLQGSAIDGALVMARLCCTLVMWSWSQLEMHCPACRLPTCWEVPDLTESVRMRSLTVLQ